MLPSMEPSVAPGESSSEELAESPLPSPSPPIPSSHSRVPSLRSISDLPNISASSTPLGPVSAARRGPSAGPIPLNAGMRPDLQARLQAFQASRMGTPAASGAVGGMSPVAGKQFNIGGRPTGPSWNSAPASSAVGGMSPVAGKQFNIGSRPAGPSWNSAPAIASRPNQGMPKPSLAQRRSNFPGGLPGSGAPPTTPADGGGVDSPTLPDSLTSPGARKRPHPGKLSVATGGESNSSSNPSESLFDKYSRFVDARSGSLTFSGKAVLHGRGVDFTSGTSFRMSLDEIQMLEELGKGNYGTVYKVIHRKRSTPARRGSFSRGQQTSTPPEMPNSSDNPTPEEQDRSLSLSNSLAEPTTMAMKEIRLELDENKFAQIIMELDVLHRCRSPYIIDFFGAFFQEGAVYICMEHMDGGSIDKLYQGGVPEGVLRKIAYATIVGLKTLKEDHNIIHRDVKPTNILVNSRGDVKLCDFGVSGNLVASIAKTNIGCQSYMAPERIASGGAQAARGGGGPVGTYGVQSDIWSLGLSILECAMGCYPYPPETYNNIFSQLSAIVDGEPPDLPEEGFTPEARDFVRGCLHKIPNLRPTYAMLLQHPWVADLAKPVTISEEDEEAAANGADFDTPRIVTEGDAEVREWALGAMARRARNLEQGISGPEKPALHAAPLDAVPNQASGAIKAWRR